MSIHPISGEQWENLLQGLARGEYHLLLGAGASSGALGGDDNPLPLARKLVEELVSDFGVDTEGEELTLQTAYEVVENRKDKQGRSIAEYFKDRFTNCQPTWQTLLGRFRWKAIWTFNVDDVVERAYKELGLEAKQTLGVCSWNEVFRYPDQNKNELQIIHLHGYAPRLSSSMSGDNLIFSILQYIQAITPGSHNWHRIFGDMLLQDPFIVVGATLTEEYDIGQFLRRGNTSEERTHRPSLLVLPKFRLIDKERFTKWNFIPIEETGESFFRRVAQEVPKVEAQVAPLVSLQDLNTLPPEVRIFTQQFHWLRLDSSPNEPREHDLYQGDDPRWTDILQDRDAKFEVVDRLISDIKSRRSIDNHSAEQIVYCISGEPGTGKSTALLRLGKELIAEGFDVFLFRGEEKLDTEATSKWLERSPKSILLIDNLADFAYEVGDLAALCNTLRIQAVVVTTERDNRLQRVYEGIAAEYLRAEKNINLDRMSDLDIERLLQKLEAARRLGKITRWHPNQRQAYFRSFAKRQLIVAMIELEGAKGFVARLLDEYRTDIHSIESRSIYGLTCMAYVFGYPLPIGIACTASNMKSNELIHQMRPSGELERIGMLETKGLRPRHRVVASIVNNNALSQKERFDLSQALARALAPYVTPNTIRTRSLPYRIARELMDSDVITKWVGERRADEWYQQLVSEYGWNARFWEQRAITEAKRGHYLKAHSYAEQALSIRGDAFSYNTLGAILLQMATNYYPAGSDESHDFFWKGVHLLSESREMENRQSIYPYKTFFTNALDFARRAYSGHIADTPLAREWHRWMRDAQNAGIFGHSDNYARLYDWQHQWLSFAVPEFRDSIE